MIKYFDRYFKMNVWVSIILISLLYFISLTIEFKYIFTDDFYIESLGNRITYGTISDFIRLERDTQWANYLITFIVILLPAVLIAFILNVGVLLKGYTIKYSQLFNITVKAQLVFALNYMISTLLKWGGILENNYDTINHNYAYQSVLYFLKNTELPFWIKYSLQIVNLTELIHILFLSLGFSFISKVKFKKALSFVFIFYGMALVFWIIITVFIRMIFYS